MKKLFIPAVLIFAMTCCTSKSGNTEAASDNDSLSKDTVAVAAETPEAKYLSLDLEMFGLTGKVKSVNDSYEECDANGKPISTVSNTNKAEFDEKGMLVKGGCFFGISVGEHSVERDKAGHIVKDLKEDDDTYEVSEFKYEGNRIVSSNGECQGELSISQTDTFTYDKNGNLEKCTTKGITDGNVFTNTSTFKYLEYDDKGNWTKAVITHVEEMTEPEIEGESEPATSHYTNYTRIVRKIEYYK